MTGKGLLSEIERAYMRREEAIEAILAAAHDRDVIVGTTGMLSR